MDRSVAAGKAGGKHYSAVGMGPLVGQLGEWLCRAVQPPAPTPCGSPGGPPITARRVRLRDGRHLAYEESGVPMERARFRVVFSHGFTGSRLDSLRASPVSALRPPSPVTELLLLTRLAVADDMNVNE